MRRIFATLVALALLAVPSLALADTTNQINETVTVASTLQVTGIPTTVSFGTLAAGASSTPQTFTANINANAAWHLSVQMTSALSGSAGSIAKSAETLALTGSGFANVANPPGSGNPAPLGDPEFDGITAVVSGAAGASTVASSLVLNVPPTAGAGSYSGTLVYTWAAP